MCGAELPPPARRKRQAAAAVTVVAAAERTCPSCGAPVARKAKKCLMCGASLFEAQRAGGEKTGGETESVAVHEPVAERGRRCPACGAPVAGTAVACLMCGADLAEESATAPGFVHPVSLPRWRRLLHVAWVVLKLPLATVLAGGILLGVGVLLVNQPWKPAAVIDSPLVTPMDTPMDTPTRATPTDIAAPTFTPNATSTDTPPPTATATATPTPAPVITYTVQLGDSWISIANQFRVEAVALAQFNGRSVNDILLFDEVIRIPPPGDGEAPASPTHVVQRGDSVERIALRYNTSVEALRIANALAEDYVLIVGEVLVIPLGTPTPPTPTPTNTHTPTATSTATATPWPDTPTPVVGYPAPVLLTPPDGQVVEGEDAVLLTWASVGVLADDEWYVLRLRAPGDVEQPEEVWTRVPSWRVPADLRPAQGTVEEPFRWQVAVVRLVETLPDGSRRAEAQSPPSEMRSFYWR